MRLSLAAILLLSICLMACQGTGDDVGTAPAIGTAPVPSPTTQAPVSIAPIPKENSPPASQVGLGMSMEQIISRHELLKAEAPTRVIENGLECLVWSQPGYVVKLVGPKENPTLIQVDEHFRADESELSAQVRLSVPQSVFKVVTGEEVDLWESMKHGGESRRCGKDTLVVQVSRTVDSGVNVRCILLPVPFGDTPVGVTVPPAGAPSTDVVTPQALLPPPKISSRNYPPGTFACSMGDFMQQMTPIAGPSHIHVRENMRQHEWKFVRGKATFSLLLECNIGEQRIVDGVSLITIPSSDDNNDALTAAVAWSNSLLSYASGTSIDPAKFNQWLGDSMKANGGERMFGPVHTSVSFSPTADGLVIGLWLNHK